jgi:hypothetical protein
MNTNSLLQNIVEKPAMYFGNRNGYLRDIEACDIGYTAATDRKACLIPVEFKEYILHKLAPNNPKGLTWIFLIREQALGERAEWDLFKRLWKEYEVRTRM